MMRGSGCRRSRRRITANWAATAMLVGTAVFAAPFAPACKRKNDAGDAGDAERPVPVEVQAVEKGTVRDIVTYVGEVRPSAQVNVMPRLAERIVAIHFEEGDWVEGPRAPGGPNPERPEGAAAGRPGRDQGVAEGEDAPEGRGDQGEIMAELSGDVVDTGIRQARSGMRAISEQIRGLRQQRDRLARLVADGIAPIAQIEPIEAQIAALEAQRSQLRAGVDQAELRMDDTVIRAPMSGYVSRRFVEAGDTAVPGMPIATIVRLDPVHVWVDVPEYEIDAVRRHPAASVRVQSAPDRWFPATVDLVSPSVDRESRSVRVRYLVANPDGTLRDGMVADVEVELDRREGALVAPLSALQADILQVGGELTHTAYVVTDGAARKAVVRVGLVEGDRAEILSGLSQGDDLVVLGFHMLEDGQAVEIVRRHDHVRMDAAAAHDAGAAAAEGGGG